MASEHDFKKFPELTNRQIEELQFQSPHKQITENFRGEVVKVIDGDTIRLFTDFRDFIFPIRFLDIDSKELNEGGKEAGDWLREKLLGEIVEVQIDPNNRVDRYGRLLGRIFYRGMDVGQEELYLGLALPFGQRNEGKIPVFKPTFEGG